MDIFSILWFLILLQQIYSNITSIDVCVQVNVEEEEDVIFPGIKSVIVLNHGVDIIDVNDIVHVNPLFHTMNSPITIKSSYEIIQLPLKKPIKSTNKKRESNRNYSKNQSSCCKTKGRCGGTTKYSCSSKKPRRCCSESESSSCCGSSTEESTCSSETETESESSEDDNRRKSKKSRRSVRSGCGCGCKDFVNCTLIGNNTDEQFYYEEKSDSADDNDRNSSPEDVHRSYKFDEEKDTASNSNSDNDYWLLQKNLYDQIAYRDKNETVAFTSNWWEKEESSVDNDLVTAAVATINVERYTGENPEEKLFRFCCLNIFIVCVLDNIFKLILKKSHSKIISKNVFRIRDFCPSEFNIDNFLSAGAVM